MYGFTVKWLGREDLPQIPQGMLFSGVPREQEHGRVQTPVICWGKSKAFVFDDRVHHQHAWLVVYGDGEHVTGGHCLTDFRHILDIKESPKGVALDLYDSHGRTVEITHLQLDALQGGKGRESEREGLPTNIPFYLSNGRDLLAADEGGVYVAARPDALVAQWLFKDGRLTHVASRQVLGLGLRPLPAARDTGKWHLSPKGELRYGDDSRGLVADPATGEVWLQAQDKEAPGMQWQVKWLGPVDRSKAANLLVKKLEIRVQVADELRAGTSDKVYFSINRGVGRQFLAEDFERGSLLRATADLTRLFPGQSLFADDLDSVELYQVSSDGYGPAWRMSSLDLVINDEMSNRILGSDSAWLLPADGANWSGRVNWLDWRHEHGDTPLDYAGYTYPIQWQPMLADWLSWRSYEPSTLEGVCQLIGVTQGRVLAYDLKSKSPVYLKANTDNDAYTWVYTPQGSIIVKHWDKAASRDQYVRHSQLGAGKPVVCAGEASIKGSAVHDLLGMINDASGHYKPDGGACLVHVLERLGQLGFDTSSTQVHSRQEA